MKKIQLGGHRKGSDIKGFALVDDMDFDSMNGFKWTMNNSGYAVTRGKNNQKGKLLFMHHMVLGCSKEIDHINRNPVDNRKDNLRVASKKENGANRGINKNNKCGFKGVVWLKRNKKWMAGIKVDYKRKHLGLFETKDEAATAYNIAALKYFGEFAYLNSCV